ncbi:hypothetical protein RB195_013440 [Necator americanus]|uniref:Uncharacterized protein n=1 Tax=Necator americanus TaxID=51031 RepID=A0ABR1DY84_NECAM
MVWNPTSTLSYVDDQGSLLNIANFLHNMQLVGCSLELFLRFRSRRSNGSVSIALDHFETASKTRNSFCFPLSG